MTATVEELGQELLNDINSSFKCICDMNICTLDPGCSRPPAPERSDGLCNKCGDFKEKFGGKFRGFEVDSQLNIDVPFHCHCEFGEEDNGDNGDEDGQAGDEG